jgi:signal transduction histidine kinase
MADLDCGAVTPVVMPAELGDSPEAERRRTWLAGLSHDLRQTLTLILGTTQMAERRLVMDGPLLGSPAAALEVIRNASHRLERQLTDLDDFAILEAEHVLALNRRAVNLAEIARDCMNRHAGLSDVHTFTVVVDGDESSPIVGLWDALRLERAIDNLVGNAIKYSPGGGSITIKISRSAASPLGVADAGLGVLEVRDEGVGIPPEDLPHVFKWFRRAQNAESISTGTGIGLAVVQQVIEQHGGTVEAASEPGRGSTFTLRLPLNI